MKHPELIVFGVDGGLDSYIVESCNQGKLPHFARLLKKGVRFEELRPVHPTVTPVCWSAFQTGATPEVNGIISDLLHLTGSISAPVSGYHGNYLQAERFWESAARIGKTSLITSLPVSGPSRSPLVRQLEGTTCEPGRRMLPDSPAEYYDVPQQLWLFDGAKHPVEDPKAVMPYEAPVGRSGKVIAHNQVLKGLLSPSPVQTSGNGKYTLHVRMDEPDCNFHRIRPFNWEITAADGGFRLKTGETEVELRPDAWAPPFRRELDTESGRIVCPFRFGCFSMGSGYVIFSSPTSIIGDRVSHPELAEIVNALPPPPVDKEYIFFQHPATARIGMDSWRFRLDWKAQFIRQAQNVLPSDILVTYTGSPDVFNHLFWSKLCGAVPTDPDDLQYIRDCYAQGYALVDDYLGFLMDEIGDEHTTILVLSDHGSLGSPKNHQCNNHLANAGLLQWLDEAAGTVDWSRTRAASCGYGNIFVNLQGREPDGIVPPEEYDATVSAIIRALQDGMRGSDGAPYLAFAARREEAGFFGLANPRCGDVLYGTMAGESAVTVHAEQIPTARLDMWGYIRCLGLLASPAIEGGRVFSDPVGLQDLAPTLCRLLGYPQPRNANGRVIAQLFPGDGKAFGTRQD